MFSRSNCVVNKIPSWIKGLNSFFFGTSEIFLYKAQENITIPLIKKRIHPCLMGGAYGRATFKDVGWPPQKNDNKISKLAALNDRFFLFSWLLTINLYYSKRFFINNYMDYIHMDRICNLDYYNYSFFLKYDIFFEIVLFWTNDYNYTL